MKKAASKTAYAGVFTALAVCTSWLERLLPAIPVPGVKLGLANVVVMAALYTLGTGTALLVAVLRVLLSGVMFGGVSSMIYGAAGGLLSFAGMTLLKHSRRPSPVGVSTAGGVLHNAGQLGIAILVVNNTGLLYYLPLLILSGAAAGAVTGLIIAYTLPYLKKLSTNKP